MSAATAPGAASWMSAPSRPLELAVGLIVFAQALAVLLLLAWASDKGLDVTDEGFYLLSARHPEDVQIWPTNAHVYLGRLSALLGHDVVLLRLAGLSLTVLSAAVFASGAWAVARALAPGFGGVAAAAAVTGAAVLAALLGYTGLLLSPSYNTLVTFAVQCSGGLLLHAQARALAGTQGETSRGLPALGAGAAAAIAFFAKFTSGTVLLGLLLVGWAALPRASLRSRATGMAAVLIGAGGWVVLHFLLFQPPDLWWRSFSGGVAHASELNPAATLSGTLERYLTESWALVRRAFKDLLAVHAGVAAGYLMLRFRGGENRGATLERVLVIAFVAGAALLFWRRLFLGGTDHYVEVTRACVAWVLLLVHLVLAEFVYLRRRVTRPALSAALPVLALFLVLGPAGAFGTSNSIGAGLMRHLLSWYALAFALLLVLARLDGTRRLSIAVATLAMTAFACSQTVTGVLREPYGTVEPLAAQTMPMEAGDPPTTLLVDAPTAAFYRELKSLLAKNGFRPGDDALALFEIPGTVFAVGGRSPGIPWYPPAYPGREPALLKAMALAPPERLRKAFIFELHGASRDLGRLDLTRVGLDFPGSYRLCGELALPYPWVRGVLRVWKPAAG